ncbi:MAG: UDP-N-acetylmuramoyl-tripeptide--D-alanyl-D-alanine ligase, partial [Xanthomonadales bacterium]|nr:UDP-N-acetylmuramoyl-tripeptide--D-alanyl-D-alanine ligase [Xanthomonadales bacterium]
MSLKQAAKLLECVAPQNPGSFTGITTDSRKVAPGMLFAALPGRTFDGHDHVDQALESGAAAALVCKDLQAGLPTLKVTDVLKALGTLAAYWRTQCPARVVGITGSNGKTTVKEMIASILQLTGDVLATEGNFNNELGLPLTLFQMDEGDEYAVLEMGASKPGDIAYLARIARPDVGVITNIGPAHLQGFLNIEGVAAEKGELYAALSNGGAAVINAAEPWLDIWQQVNNADTTYYFNGENSHVRATRNDAEVLVDTPVGNFPLRLPLPGEHNLANALAATAVCIALGVPLADIKRGLEAVKPVPGRLSIVPTKGGWTVIDDTYNANPASLYAALQVLAGQGGEPWLVIGDMLELGADSRKMHAEVGDAARSLGVKRLFAVGEATQATVDTFGEMAVHFDSREALTRALHEQLKPGVACLVKGSRSMGMEQVVHAIVNGQALQEAT